MNLDMKLKFNFNKRNKYKNICSIDNIDLIKLDINYNI